LGIVGSQIKTKKIFSLVEILTNLKKCCWQIIFLKKLIFFNKNWFNNLRIRCKPPFNLIEFLKKDIDGKVDLNFFEEEFERDEIVEA
jgi:hypothetical protein